MTDRHDPTSTRSLSARRPRVALALQGGGAHGAYGWGVVERLLEEDIDLVGGREMTRGYVLQAVLSDERPDFSQNLTKYQTKGRYVR